MSVPLRIFIIYAREDESFKTSLLKAFKPLHRSGKIEIFHDGLIKPGERWEEAILGNLRTAHIILPLVSTDFFDSEFIHEVEFKKAVERYNKGETFIIPIILKHCGWKHDPVIPTLQVLPKDGKPVETWVFQGEAWEQILDAVHEVTEQVVEKKRKEKEHKETDARRKKEEVEAKKRKEEAERFFDLGLKATDALEKIEYYSKVIELDPYHAEAYARRGANKSLLGDDIEAIKDCNQAIHINPDIPIAFSNRGNAKYNLGLYAGAIKDYDQAIRIKPDDVDPFNNRGMAKDNLGQHAEAIKDYDQALRLKPDYALVFNNRGVTKENLGLFEEAKKDYQKALSIDSNYERAKNNLKSLEAKMKK